MPRAPRSTTPLTTLRIDRPASRRMPAPSRLPEMDLDGLAELSSRPPAGLVTRIAQALFRR
jgi:hypothetical protein